MRILYRRCGGLDVHKTSVVACVLMVREGSRVEEQVRRSSCASKRSSYSGSVSSHNPAKRSSSSGTMPRQMQMHGSTALPLNWRPPFL